MIAATLPAGYDASNGAIAVVLTPLQLRALAGCIDAAENDGFFDLEISVARMALGLEAPSDDA